MRIAALLTVIASLWVLWIAPAQAVSVSGLYEANVMVEDQSDASRRQGLGQALQQVLVKVSGSRDAIASKALQPTLADPQRLVESFSYTRDPVDDALLLQVRFASHLIDQALVQAQLPVWGRSRPLVLVWQAVEDGPLRLLLGQDASLWRVQGDRAMAERGLPVLWPTLDLQDELALPVEAVWGLFSDRIESASERYRSDAVLAGRLSAVAGQWRYSGQLWHQQRWQPVSAVAGNAADAMRLVADVVADRFASQYAVRRQVTADNGFLLLVNGVRQFADYQALLNYLKANVAIDDAQVVRVDGDQLQLKLQLAAPWAQVWGVLSLDNRLQQTGQPGVVEWLNP
ncbi:hypothetical protein CHH28_17525 [Bacterioplanes sanyensis]|uniref:DUF2066 domain-containing protein n=1 Tax=Bacterioplanes sanyensis TaxID=1249553 RepID=A0A222FPA5_9GAMM|nr:DUF2066 domain-containing protein [Bacterioplanes sanyensis]ASP40366.1 hypothetical protein CHH28_17525 [Bacterioplanes sanyensis]